MTLAAESDSQLAKTFGGLGKIRNREAGCRICIGLRVRLKEFLRLVNAASSSYSQGGESPGELEQR